MNREFLVPADLLDRFGPPVISTSPRSTPPRSLGVSSLRTLPAHLVATVMALGILATACGGGGHRVTVAQFESAFLTSAGVPFKIGPQSILAGVADTVHCVELDPDSEPDGYQAGSYQIYVETKSGACGYVTASETKNADAQGFRWQFFAGTGKRGTQFYEGYQRIGNVILSITPTHGRDDVAGLLRLEAEVRAAAGVT